tara:strand:- start:8319 stop:9038 length:720 start_codon:yes stop_codon:yes gene_type:complete
VNFLDVLSLSKKINSKDYTEFFKFINLNYKPRTCIDLILSIKKEIFSSNPVYKVTRNIKGKSYNLNLEYNDFLNVKSEDDVIIEGRFKYKVNYPNVLSITSPHLNIVSIIKSIYIQNKWIDINSYDSDDVYQILSNLELDDFKIIKTKYEEYIDKISNYTYITFNKITEPLSFDMIVKFFIENFYYETKNLQQLLLSLMRHFNFTYSDFKEVDFFEVLSLINIGKEIVKEENDVNNKNE